MTTKIALIQLACSDSRGDNLKKVLKLIGEAADEGASVICLPELCLTRYFPQTLSVDFFELADEIPGAATALLSDIAREKGIYLIAPLFERESGRIFYNTALLIGSTGDIIGKYRKNHIPHNDGYQEKYYFRPGNLGYPVFDTPHGKIAVSICWDHWFVEVQRIYGLKGADIIFSPTALGLCDFPGSRIDSAYMNRWELMLRGQAIQNGVYLAVNMRCGVEDKIQFRGGSFVVNPKGEVISKLNEEEGILFADIDLDLVRRWHTHQQYFRDRRIDTYQPLLDR